VDTQAEEIRSRVIQLHEQWSQKITNTLKAAAALNYNECAHKAGNAEFLYAGNCPREAGDEFYEKLEVLESSTAFNKRAATNRPLHVSLNFFSGRKLFG
jgi:hypothetical protein